MGHTLFLKKRGSLSDDSCSTLLGFYALSWFKEMRFPTSKVILLPIVPIARAGSPFKQNN
jgi:hypothetical protein